MVENYCCWVTRKPSGGYYVKSFNKHDKKFYSMLKVGRFLKLVDEKKKKKKDEVWYMKRLAVVIGGKEGGDKCMVEKYSCQVTV